VRTGAPPAAAELHTTHRLLLDRDVTPRGQRSLDAVIVPASRPAANLRPATDLAARLGCPLLAVCSNGADPDEVLAQARDAGARVYAVDMAKGSAMPAMRTTAVRAEVSSQTPVDTSAKRNLGLAVAYLTGWERVLFLDDDIAGVDAAELGRGAGLLDEYNVVGLRNTGFPDNSVVHHAHRDTGGDQDTFIGGGAMLVARSWLTSMFPDLYNEDWLFLLGESGMARCAVYGTFAQDTFDPYQSAARARSQEFGDCIAEGLFTVLDQGRTLEAANRPFWRDFLAARKRFIVGITRRLNEMNMPEGTRGPMRASLRAAYDSVGSFDEDLCRRFLAAWKHDRYAWLAFLGRQKTGVSLDRALEALATSYDSTCDDSTGTESRIPVAANAA
jgi:hypothetical protein